MRKFFVSGKSRQPESMRLSTDVVRCNIKMKLSRRRRWRYSGPPTRVWGLLLKSGGSWLSWATASAGQD